MLKALRRLPCGTWAWEGELGAGRENRGGPGTSNAAASQQPTPGGGLGSHCVHAAAPRMPNQCAEDVMPYA